MNGRRRWLFRSRRSGFSANPKKPVSLGTKTIYVLAAISALVLMASLYYDVYMDGAYGQMFGGAGFLCMYVGLLASAFSIQRVRKDTEPLPARVLAVAVSLVSFGLWGAVYLLGTIRG